MYSRCIRTAPTLPCPEQNQCRGIWRFPKSVLSGDLIVLSFRLPYKEFAPLRIPYHLGGNFTDLDLHLAGQSRRQKTAKGTGQPKRSQSASLVPRRNVHGRKIDQQPVTNKQLKQERVQAKRTARAAQQGLSLRKINKTLHDFVCAEGDLEASSHAECPLTSLPCRCTHLRAFFL